MTAFRYFIIMSKPSASPNPQTFKIIGHGAIVRAFLADFNDPAARFEVYAHGGSRPVSEFRPGSSETTFFACSADEAALLRNRNDPFNRLHVLRANLEIVDSFIEDGVFDRGTFFILTSPSDLVAEYISRRTGNPSTYGLGLEVDLLRYRRIFEDLGIESALYEGFTLGGTHGDRPIPLFENHPELRKELSERLRLSSKSVGGNEARSLGPLFHALDQRLQSIIRSEFIGDRPPIQSGVRSISAAVRARLDGRPFLVSGGTSDKMGFSGGFLDPVRGVFSPHSPRDTETVEHLAHSANRHRMMLEPFLLSTSIA
jgi:hypothetical protein